MKQFGLRSRTVPFLKNFFELASVETGLYAAPAIDPVGHALENEMDYHGGKDGPPCPPDVTYAYSNNNGDTFFELQFSAWYVLPKGMKDAFKLGGGASQYNGVTTAAFKHELTGKLVGVLKINHAKDVAVIAGCFDDGPHKTGYTENLVRLSDDRLATLTQAVRCREIGFIGIPEVRALESVFRKQNGNLLVVSCNRSDYSYDALRIFTGPNMNDLREIPVVNVERMRDGGSTFFYTERGILYSPAGMDSLTIAPKWLKGAHHEFHQQLRNWTDEKSPAEKLTRLKVSDMTREISGDARLTGAQPWAQISRSLPRPDVI
jgi:hypothetical protein